MIFGLVAALLLSSVVMLMINSAFWQIVAVQIVGTATNSFDARASGGVNNIDTGFAMAGSPLTMVFFLIAYVGLIVSALNKCFAAIYIIPERVMRWIGSQGDQYGEEAAVGELKRGIEGAASTIGSGASNAMQSGAKQAQEMGKDRESAKQKANAASLQASGGGGGGGTGGGGAGGGGTGGGGGGRGRIT